MSFVRKVYSIGDVVLLFSGQSAIKLGNKSPRNAEVYDQYCGRLRNVERNEIHELPSLATNFALNYLCSGRIWTSLF